VLLRWNHRHTFQNFSFSWACFHWIILELLNNNRFFDIWCGLDFHFLLCTLKFSRIWIATAEIASHLKILGMQILPYLEEWESVLLPCSEFYGIQPLGKSKKRKNFFHWSKKPPKLLLWKNELLRRFYLLKNSDTNVSTSTKEPTLRKLWITRVQQLPIRIYGVQQYNLMLQMLTQFLHWLCRRDSVLILWFRCQEILIEMLRWVDSVEWAWTGLSSV
jgi:hypothetical protein